MLNAPNITGEQVLNLGDGPEGSFVKKATDPLILPQPYSKPGDFAAQYPQPLDPTEIIAMCEEITAWQAIPEQTTALNAETWRHISFLRHVTGTSLIAFADGECPEEYSHTGGNRTVSHKNIGAKKTLSQRDIRHSMAVASANWHGINTLVGGFPSGEGIPGGSNVGTFAQEFIASVKEKEVRLAMTLVLNGWDRLLVLGDATTRPLEFDGIENIVTAALGAHSSTAGASGTITGIGFDRFLSESCAKPTHIFGHPQVVQELLSAYFQLGFAGSQVVNFADGNRITPGFNFAGFVNTGVGRMAVVADNNFTRTASGATTFQSNIYALRMTHNGEPLVYKSTQIPLVLTDLAPGCTAVSFVVWAATALIIKAMCAQGFYTSLFTGEITTSCPTIG